MSSGNATQEYEFREIDEQLQKAAIGWLRPTSKLRWISLKSKAGNGNSALLKHFREWMGKYQAGFDDMKTLHIRGEANLNSSLGRPLLVRIAQLQLAGRRTRRQRLTQGLRHAPPARKITAGAVLICFLALLSLWAGMSEYNKSPEAPWTSLRLWTSGFVFGFLPAHWYKLPIWLITDAFSGVFLAGALSSLVIYLSRGSFFDKLQRERVKEKDLRALKSDHGLVDALLEITRNCRGLILLVDDAQRLPDDEKQLLADLVAPPSQRPELAGFVARRRLLVVTLEAFEVRWPQRPDAAVQTLDVPDFTVDALGRIAWTQLEGFGRMKEVDREDLLLKAQGNINALFAGRVEAFDKEVGRLFEAASAEGFPDVFDRKDLMAYWAVSRATSVSKTEMKEWLAALDSGGHLREFGLSEVESLPRLVNEFPQTTLARREGQVYFFDLARCQALSRWVRKGDSDEPRRLLARAHYFWFRHLSSKLSATGAPPVAAAKLSAADRQEIKEAAWHVFQINKYLDESSEVLAAAAGLDAAGREECRYTVAAVLLTASAIYRSEGNTTESNELVIEAFEWLPEGERRRQWLEHAAGHLWQNFWLTGSAAAVKSLADLAAHSPGLADSALWRACRRYEQLLRCEVPLAPAPDETLLSDELRNLQRLTDTLHDIRHNYGLVYLAFGDPEFGLREPLPAPGVNFHESRLRELQAAALLVREDEAGLARSLAAWRARLVETEPVAGSLGDDALHCYQQGRYWHTLADVCRAGVSRIKNDRNIPHDEKEQAEAELFERVLPFCLKPPPPESASLPAYLWLEGLAAYERSLQLATFLNYQPLVLEVSFREGELLEAHTPDARRKALAGGEPWWARWDWLFWQALNLEREFDWIIHTPIMHRIRWQFFSDGQDKERSVEDAYNALQSIKRANYSRRLIVHWHKEVSKQLTDHSDSAEDRRRDAELNEEWADTLAAFPEAKEHWNFDTLNFEQASALSFAAQARRFIDELDPADKLLDRAEALVAAAAGENGASTESQNLRNLKNSLKIQRAWIRKAQERQDDYERAMWETWAVMSRADRECGVVLRAMFEIERHKKLADDPWPPPGAEPHEDRDNPALSLPAEWFEGASALQLKNRFEFRFYQLLSLINHVEWRERISADDEFPQWSPFLRYLDLITTRMHAASVAALPEQLFHVQMLKAVAQLDWFNLNNFAEIARAFAGYGLTYSHTAQTRALIVNLLEAVRFYFSEEKKVDRHELEALRLLMEYEPDSPKNYRLEYVKVLCQNKHLLEHERLARDGVVAHDWYATAKLAHEYMFMLIDKELRGEKIGIEAQRLGIEASAFLDRQAAMRAGLQAALKKYEGGDPAASFAALTPLLPVEPSPWVFMEDLEALHLWLRCAPRDGDGDGGGLLEVQRREAQLRAFARQYIRQLRVVIREAEVQQLVAGLVDGLHDSI
ncbi:MAG TPA: hypothetical protein VF703_18930 [Pyrinomonadaceae bacterium]|jgi:hypothetical protein